MIWRDLSAWLRAKGVRQQKAIRPLRKEIGSLIALMRGIEAARQRLGHRDIRTTSSHYVDKKKRVEVNLPIGGMTGKFTWCSSPKEEVGCRMNPLEKADGGPLE